jgi:hypothetical protein
MLRALNLHAFVDTRAPACNVCMQNIVARRDWWRANERQETRNWPTDSRSHSPGYNGQQRTALSDNQRAVAKAQAALSSSAAGIRARNFRLIAAKEKREKIAYLSLSVFFIAMFSESQ